MLIITLHLNGVAPETISDGVQRAVHDLRALIHDAIHLDDLSPGVLDWALHSEKR